MSKDIITKIDNTLIESKHCLLIVFAPLISVINLVFNYILLFERNT